MRLNAKVRIVDPYWSKRDKSKINLDSFDARIETELIDVGFWRTNPVKVPGLHVVVGTFSADRTLGLRTQWWVISDDFDSFKVLITDMSIGRNRLNEYEWIGIGVQR